MVDNRMRVFVSMPYGRGQAKEGYWQRFYTDGILGLRSLLNGRDYSVEFALANASVHALALKEHVKKSLDECDACLAIVTGWNPNVFWEIGYADARGIPIIVAVAKGVEEDSFAPVIVSHALRVEYDGTLFDQPNPDPVRLQTMHYDLIRFLDHAHREVRGIQKPEPQYRVFANRRGSTLPTAVATAKKSIDLITTNLSYFADVDNFVVVIDGQKRFAFEPPIERGVKVRLLALDPDSTIASYRAKQLGLEHDVAGYREALRTAARFFYSRYLDKKNVDIRIYDDLPLQITAIIDGRVMTSIVSRGQAARENIHVEFDLNYTGARETFERHFAEVLASQSQTSHISRFSWAKSIP